MYIVYTLLLNHYIAMTSVVLNFLVDVALCADGSVQRHLLPNRDRRVRPGLHPRHHLRQHAVPTIQTPRDS